MTAPRFSRPRRRALALMLVLAGGTGVAAGVLRPWQERGGDAAYDTSVAAPALASTRPRVYFDHGHDNSHSITGRFAPFASLLRSDGCDVRQGQGRIDPRTLAGADILVIVNALGPAAKRDQPAFTPEEIESVRAWIEAGGSLLLAADHHPCGSAAAELSAAIGVTMMCGWCDDPANLFPATADPGAIAFRRDRSMLGSHPITDGRSDDERLDIVVTYTGQSLVAPPGATPLLLCADTAIDQVPIGSSSTSSGGVTTTTFETTDSSAAGHCQALAMTLGAGRVVITGEAAMLSAQIDRESGLPFGMNVPGTHNRQFVLNAVRWLAHTPE